ncbi:LysE family transporter [Piscinibacterium candidicorallinum]|uniref:LysE family transporter n=1 Tax=Piscinibacterium candidicorallinum TaxID=1793872 RepID=A0ABV7H6H9_9BURK
MQWTTWLAFFAASWAISISPGAGAVAAMSSGAAYGFRRGYWTTAGLISGIWLQVLLVAVGLGALIAASSTAFLIVKWLGVAYLVYLGLRVWKDSLHPSGGAIQVEQGGTATRRSLVLKGFVVNAMNPKGTVFLLAVMPQFLDPHAPLVPQYLIIALTLGFTDLVVMGVYTALAARVLAVMNSPRQTAWINRFFGSLFILAGAWLATFKRAA